MVRRDERLWKLRYGKVYDSILATPIAQGRRRGETIWAVVRAMLYSAAYLLVITALGLSSRRGRSRASVCFVIGFGLRSRSRP